MAQQAQSMDLKVSYGITPTQVFLGFSFPIPNLLLTPQQCRDMMANMQKSLDELEARIKAEAS